MTTIDDIEVDKRVIAAARACKETLSFLGNMDQARGATYRPVLAVMYFDAHLI